MFPHPKVDYDAGAAGFPSGTPTLQDQLLELLMLKRLDSADHNAALEFEGEPSWGNPDRYGPNPAPVRVPGTKEPKTTYAEEEHKLKRAE
jgi:hypothetical protein